MKQKNWKKWELAGLFFAIATGNLLHFVYDWSGESLVAAVISGVNESTWEHMKLLFLPKSNKNIAWNERPAVLPAGLFVCQAISNDFLAATALGLYNKGTFLV